MEMLAEYRVLVWVSSVTGDYSVEQYL